MIPFTHSREISATVEQVFAAFSDPARLARWWGPEGFTNTFDVCEFRPGGRWSFVMHSPNGRNFPNESIFAEVVAPLRVVVVHASEPKYRLTITLAPTVAGAGTVVTWSQAFEKPETAKALEHIVVPANEQNLDRLAAEAARGVGGH